MEYSKDQLEELKRYCSKVSTLTEGGVTFLYLEGLRLPEGCHPQVCCGLLCPVARDGYPSRLYFSEQIMSPFARNWNVSNARIGERNWFAFSWRVELVVPTLAQILVAHLAGLTREK
jgi:hypothetical protein